MGSMTDRTEGTMATIHDRLGMPLDSPSSLVYNWKYGLVVRERGKNRIVKCDRNDIQPMTDPRINDFSGEGGIFMTEEGELYIADAINNMIRKVNLNGEVSTVAGRQEAGCSPEGELVCNTVLNNPSGVFVHCGMIYIADTGNNRILLVTQNGTTRVLAGNGKRGSEGDGKSARFASLNAPKSVFVNSFNEVYIADSGNNKIRKIDTNSIISTVAGNEKPGFNGDGKLATETCLNDPSVVSYRDGEVYILDGSNKRVRKITRDQVMHTIFCAREEKTSGAPIEFDSSPSGLFVYGDGTVFVSTEGDGVFVIRKERLLPSLEKHERDLLKKTSITVSRSVLDILSPTFYEKVLKRNDLVTEHENTIQKIIDFLMYEKTGIALCDPVDTLAILGLVEDSVFDKLKDLLIERVMESFSGEDGIRTAERASYLVRTIESRLIRQIYDYCPVGLSLLIGRIPWLIDHQIVIAYSHQIVKLSLRTKMPTIDRKIILSNHQPYLGSLFNNARSSDVVVNVGIHSYYCHRTILSSASPILKKLVDESGAFFSLERCETKSVNNRHYEALLKSCYTCPLRIEKKEDIHPTILCLEYYQMHSKVDAYVSGVEIDLDNFFLLCTTEASKRETLRRRLLDFGVRHLHEIFIDMKGCGLLDPSLKDELMVEYLKKNGKTPRN